ncbi:DsbA family protein [Candidatus Binatia bacterium]|nr:DsbA family protein [Candidatus Binatia bacterium]
MAKYKRYSRLRTPLSPRALSHTQRSVFLGLAAIGFVTSLYLTYIHHRVGLDPKWASICAISPALNCDTVVASPYGSLLGAPLSAYAAWFYAVVVALALRRSRPHRHLPRSPALLLLLGGTLAVAFSVVLAFVSAAWIGSICLLCGVLYLVNLGVALVAWLALRATGEHVRTALRAELLSARRRPVSAAVLSTFSLAFLAAIPWAYLRQPSQPASACKLLADPSFAPPVSLVIYSDFQCPHCRTLDRSLRPLRGITGLRIVARQYPLDSACNSQVKRSRHPGACLQARAAICAAAQERYDDLSDRLFDEQAADVAAVVALARSLGLDKARFESCLWSEQTTDELSAHIREAIAAGARGTPTVLINGKRHAGGFGPEELACLEQAANRASTPSNSSRRTRRRRPWYTFTGPLLPRWDA